MTQSADDDAVELTPFQAQVIIALAAIQATLLGHTTTLRTLQTRTDLIMTAQDDIAAAQAAILKQNSALAGVVAGFGPVLTNLQAGEAAIKAEILALQGQGVDTTGLNAAAALMDTQPLVDAAAALAAEVQNVDNIAPAPPAGP